MAAIKKHYLSFMIELIQGSSINQKVFNKVKLIAKNYSKRLVILDSDHTYRHILSELELYTLLVLKGSYCIVFATLVGGLPKENYKDRPWGPKNNSKITVKEFIKNNKNFIIDRDIY